MAIKQKSTSYTSQIIRPSIFKHGFIKLTVPKKKLRGFSPPANYTDRATAACRRS
jgi:hypothetical protein